MILCLYGFHISLNGQNPILYSSAVNDKENGALCQIMYFNVIDMCIYMYI